MDSRKSFGIQSRKNAFCSHVAVLLLLSFSICIPVAVGSGHERHFELRGRGLVPAIAFSPPPAPINSAEPLVPTPPPTPSSPPLPPLPLVLPTPLLFPPPSVLDLPLIFPPPPTAIPPLSPPLESPLPPELPPLESPPTIVNPADTWNQSEKAGVVIASIAALLQVAVVAFLLIKRHQMLTTVEYEDFEDEYDNPDSDYSHPESA